METGLSLVVVVRKTFHLFVFYLQHLLDQEHLPLFLNQLVTIFNVFLAFAGDSEAVELGYVDLALDLGVYGQLARFDVGLAQLTQAAFPDWPVFLPDALVLVSLAFLRLPLLFVVLKSENHLAKFVLRNDKRVGVSVP